MIPNKPCKEKQGHCCHCCTQCYPKEGKPKYLPGKCGICVRFNRKCPFGLESGEATAISPEFADLSKYATATPSYRPADAHKTDINIRPGSSSRKNHISLGSTQEGAELRNQLRRDSPRAWEQPTNIRGSSVRRVTMTAPSTVPLIGSQIIHHPIRLAHSFIRPLYIVPSVVQVQPYYYNITVPLKLEQTGRARLVSSMVRQSNQPAQAHHPRQQSRSRQPRQPLNQSFGIQKNSRSTFDRSKMKMSLMLSNMSKNKDPPIPPSQVRNIIVHAFDSE